MRLTYATLVLIKNR